MRVYYEQDYILRQIEVLLQSLRRIFLGEARENLPEEAGRGEIPGALWYKGVLERLDAGDIGGAEDLLFAQLEPGDAQGLLAALDFYGRLRRLPEEVLEAADFPLAEVEQGLLDVFRLYGLDIAPAD